MLKSSVSMITAFVAIFLRNHLLLLIPRRADTTIDENSIIMLIQTCYFLLGFLFHLQTTLIGKVFLIKLLSGSKKRSFKA